MIHALLMSVLAGCATSEEPDQTEILEEDTAEDPLAVELLAELLVGRFDSGDQAADNGAYYDISLVMCPVSLPELGETVLYVEQALADTPTEPYRQRLYVLESGEPAEVTAISRVFELRRANTYVSTCDDPESFDASVDAAVELEGCDVYLDWDGSRFSGGTIEDHCGTDWQGAVYATSDIALDETTLESWDRGYNSNDQQVWGATQGAYVFTRRSAIGAWD